MAENGPSKRPSKRSMLDQFQRALRSILYINVNFFLTNQWHPKCTMASQPQSLAIFGLAGKIARNFRSEKQIWPFFIAKRIATATLSVPQRNRNLFPRKNRCVQFDLVNESQASTANHRWETVHLHQCGFPVFSCLFFFQRLQYLHHICRRVQKHCDRWEKSGELRNPH